MLNPSRPRLRGENGTVLMQQDLLAAATDAANDAATAGLDEAALRSGRGFELDPSRVWLVAVEALATRGVLDNLSSGPDVSVNQDGSVTVSLSKRVPHLFARALPGAPDNKLVLATATATVQQR